MTDESKKPTYTPLPDIPEEVRERYQVLLEVLAQNYDHIRRLFDGNPVMQLALSLGQLRRQCRDRQDVVH